MDQTREPPTRRQTIVMGTIGAAVGLYFVLVSVGVAPSPGRANAPMGVVLLAGLCFLLGGLAVVIPAAVTGQVRADGELPADAPHWLRLLQYLLGMIILASLAMVGTWVAFGAGERSFSISAPFVTSSGGSEMLGRTAFGIGAAVSWLCLIAVGISGWRKLIRRKV